MITKQQFILAVLKNNIDVVKQYIEEGGDIHFGDDNLKDELNALVKSKKNKINMKEILPLGKSRFYKEWALFYCCEKGYFDMVKLLVEHGANIHEVDKYVRTPLYLALKSKNLDIIKYLIEKGANVNHKDYDNYTPLHFAAYLGLTEIVKLLVEKNAEVNVYNWYEETPIFLAVYQEYIEIVEILLENNAEINIKNANEETLLTLALDRNNFEIVKLLLSKGIQVQNYAEIEKLDFNLFETYFIFNHTFKNIDVHTIKMLIDNNSSKNEEKLKTIFKLTPCLISQKEIVDLLIRTNKIDLILQKSNLKDISNEYELL